MGGGGKGGGGGSPPSGPYIGTYDEYLANGGKASREEYYGANPGAPGAPPFSPDFPEFHYPGGSADDYEAKLEAQRLKDLRTAGENDRDNLYSDYMSAAGSATDFINTQITQERANAALLGIDYDLTDEQKNTRISDYFASIWGEGDQSRLEGLFDKWGNPEGFEKFSIIRGDGSAVDGEENKSEIINTTTGTRPTLAENEEEVLGGLSILGGG